MCCTRGLSGSLYGLSWVVTRSKLCAGLRSRLSGVRFLGEVVQCTVCTASWLSLPAMALLPSTSLFSEGFGVRQPADAVVLGGWVVFTTWALAHLLGDAD